MKQDALGTPDTASVGTRVFDPSRIAIVIPVYNAADTVERAVGSALKQDMPDDIALEIVIVDDCSSDNTAEICRALAQAHDSVTFLQQTQNAGPSAARNRALEATDAAWFTPLDADDHMAPSRIASLYKTALSGGWAMVADNLLIAYSDAPQTAQRYLWPGKPAGQMEMTLENFVAQNLRTVEDRSELGFLKPLIDRRVLDTSQPIYDGSMRFEEDYDLYTRLLAQGSRSCLIDPLGYYAVRVENSLSSRQKAIDFQRLLDCDKRLLADPRVTGQARAMIKRHLRENQNEWVWLRAIDAVKARNWGGLVACFVVSPSASVHLLGQLLGQLGARTVGKLGSKPAQAAGE